MMIKIFIKYILHLLGFDIVRINNKLIKPKYSGICEREEEEEQTNRLFSARAKDENNWILKSGIKTVLDVGAHLGEFSHKIRKVLPQVKIYSFEPLNEEFLKLKSRFAEDKNFHPLNYALGDTNGQCEIYHNEYAATSSMLQMDAICKKEFPFTIKSRVEIIEVRRLSDIAHEIDIDDPVLIKIDAQGFEEKIIDGGSNIISVAKIIIIEVSFEALYHGSPLFDDIYRKLTGMGYKLMQYLLPRDKT
jgi:FkbM family methyltransferase